MACLLSFVVLVTIFALFIWNIEAVLPYSNGGTWMEHKRYCISGPSKEGEVADFIHQNAGEVSYWCSTTSHKKPCMFFCQKYCAKCLCVTPGTYGNKQVCPCYNNWKTQQGGPKCP